MKKICLTQGYETTVDDEDFDRLSHLTWRVSITAYGKAYATRSVTSNINGKRTAKTIFMHREITQATKPFQVDHINGDGLDNRRINLRIVTQAENNRNVRLRKTSKSGMAGVTWYRPLKKWKARFSVDGKEQHLGYFENLEDALKARKEGELKYWGAQNRGVKYAWYGI